MTKKRLFKTAHSLTRKLVTPGISYRSTFGLALRALIQDFDAACVKVMKLERMIKTIREGHEAIDLPTIVGVSEKQISYANKVRGERFATAMRACMSAVDAGASVDDIDIIRIELRTNADARFWLDVVSSADGGIDPFYVLRPIAMHIKAAGRAPAMAA